MWLYARLYHTMCGYTLNAWLCTFVNWHSTLPYMAIYVVMHPVRGSMYIFTLNASLYTVLRSPTLALHQIWLYVLLYHTMRGYTLNVWLYTLRCATITETAAIVVKTIVQMQNS